MTDQEIGLLISVNSTEEAILAAYYADCIDFKDPAVGANGALPIELIKTAIESLHREKKMTGYCSATIGDQPLDPEFIVPAVRAYSETGVDYVKIGISLDAKTQGWSPALEAALAPLAELTPQQGLIAVVFANQKSFLPPLDLLALYLASLGFAGMMVDTAQKHSGSLLDHCDMAWLESFVTATKGQGLLCGLAGSLSIELAQRLAPLAPDYLGFRGGLTKGGRNDALDPAKLIALKLAFPSSDCEDFIEQSEQIVAGDLIQTTRTVTLSPRFNRQQGKRGCWCCGGRLFG